MKPLESDVCIEEVQRYLRRRLYGQEPPPYILGYDSKRQELQDLIRRTAAFGESNSILVIGPRGSGKSLLIRSILGDSSNDKEVQNNLMVVRLNGLLQIDDKIALKEITRQLSLENTVGDRVFGSFAENLQFLLSTLKSGGKHSKSILFVLDEFDLFSNHKNQTLLYNLFDVAQSAQAPICVVGLTTRLDVMELLEKRVKSRFSHRQLHLLANPNLAEYTDIFLAYLKLSNDSISKQHKKFIKQWNDHVDSLQHESPIQDVLQQQFSINKDIRALLTLMILPVSRVSSQRPKLEVQDFVQAFKLQHTDSKAAMLHGISVLELCLVISMHHLLETYGGEPFNFEMVYNDYNKFCQKRSSMQRFDKAVVLKAFEHLCALELVRPQDSGGSKVQKEYRLMTLLIDGTQITESLKKYPGCPTEVKQWFSSAVI